MASTTVCSSWTDELREAAASTHSQKTSRKIVDKAWSGCERAKGVCHATKKANPIGRAGRVDITSDCCLGRPRWRFGFAR